MTREKQLHKPRPVCSKCGSPNTVRRSGKRGGFKCQDCGKYTYAAGMREGSSWKQTGDHAIVVARVPKILSDAELLAHIHADPKIWKIDKVEYGESEGYRKDRQVKWDVKNGVVTQGRVRDSGKLLIVQLISVKIYLSKRVAEIADRENLDFFIKQAKKFSPKYPKIKYPALKAGMLYEVEMPDLHLGQLTWREESGKDSDLKLTVAAANKAADELLGMVQHFPIERILIPIGHDFFNVNDKDEETIHGTRQQEDGRWQKTFRIGERLVIGIIDRFSCVAPVDVVIVPGNHDEERTFYLGEYLDAWYINNPQVNIDNRAMKRKYYAWGKTLLGLTHGYYEPTVQLASLMAHEQPGLWAKSTVREWHLGDKHHKKDLEEKTEELNNGVVVRLLRSLSAPSTWAFDKGFVGSARQAEGFLWHPDGWLKGQFSSAPV
jgi:hypothetical protein